MTHFTQQAQTQHKVSPHTNNKGHSNDAPFPSQLHLLKEFTGAKDVGCQALHGGLNGAATSLHGALQILLRYTARTKHVPAKWQTTKYYTCPCQMYTHTVLDVLAK